MLEMVGLEMTTKSVGAAVHIRRAGGREFQILGAATLQLRAPNKLQTNGTSLDVLPANKFDWISFPDDDDDYADDDVDSDGISGIKLTCFGDIDVHPRITKSVFGPTRIVPENPRLIRLFH